MKYVILTILCIVSPYFIGKGFDKILFNKSDLNDIFTYLLGVDAICIVVIITMIIYGDKLIL